MTLSSNEEAELPNLAVHTMRKVWWVALCVLLSSKEVASFSPSSLYRSSLPRPFHSAPSNGRIVASTGRSVQFQACG